MKKLRRRLAFLLAPELRELLEEGVEWALRPVETQEDAAYALEFDWRVSRVLERDYDWDHKRPIKHRKAEHRV